MEQKTLREPVLEDLLETSIRRAEDRTGVIHRSVSDTVDELCDLLAEDCRTHIWVRELLKSSPSVHQAITTVFFAIVTSK